MLEIAGRYLVDERLVGAGVTLDGVDTVDGGRARLRFGGEPEADDVPLAEVRGLPVWIAPERPEVEPQRPPHRHRLFVVVALAMVASGISVALLIGAGSPHAVAADPTRPAVLPPVATVAVRPAPQPPRHPRRHHRHHRRPRHGKHRTPPPPGAPRKITPAHRAPDVLPAA